MKIYIVWYTNSSYDEELRRVFSSLEKAQKYTDTRPDTYNYSIEEYVLDD